MNKKRQASWVKYLIAIVITAFVSTANDSSYQKAPKPYYTLVSKNLKSVLMLNAKTDSGRRATLYNSELLKYFSDDHESTIEICNAYGKSEYWDSLMRGRIDVIVADSIPERYARRTLTSTPVNGKYWITTDANVPLLNTIDLWLKVFSESTDSKFLNAKYIHSVHIYPQQDEQLSNGKGISSYDAIFKKYGKLIGWDWRLLASLVYQESRFSMGVQASGAVGLMQIKSGTANYYGVNDIYDPDLNIKAGALHLQRLGKIFQSMGLDSANVIKFSLAAYNAGEGRIDNCMDLAAEKGLDNRNWEEVCNVFPYIPNFSGAVTKRYVSDIITRYQRYCATMK
jgi:membrane-bound lytic murein transglycosylase F